MAIDPRIYDGLAEFRGALRRFLAIIEAATLETDITPQQYQALLALKAYEPAGLSIGELAKQLVLQHNGTVQLVNRLAQTELIERRPSQTDGRSVIVALTRKGEALLDQLTGDHLQELLDHAQLLAESLRRLRQLERPRKVRLD
ncbi:MAG TPA: MarR family transcriptional regulator [Stellaceae bacterium]|nr:MarR family transcriptional regulator [Stellaceae bacterium]